MDYRYVQAFYHVAKELSFVRAAELMGIAPSAITRQIRLFEESCGKTFLLRTPKKVALTQEGKELLKVIEDFFAKTETLAERKVSLGCLQSVFEIQLAESFRLKSTWWKENLDELIIGTPQQLEHELIQGRLDFIFTNKRPQTKQFGFEIWSHEDYKILSPHPSSKTLGSEVWLLTPAFLTLFEGLGLAPRRTIQVNSFNAYLEMIFSGLGAGIVPKGIETPKGLHAHAFPLASSRQALYLVYLSSRYKPSEVKSFKRNANLGL